MGSRRTTDPSAPRHMVETHPEEIASTRSASKVEESPQPSPEIEIRGIEFEIQNEQLKQALAESEARHEHDAELFALAPVGYFNIAQDGTILNVNEWGASLVGSAREKLTGERFESLLAEPRRPEFTEFLQQTFATGARLTCELTLTIHGETDLFVNAKAMRSKDGNECRLVLVDETQRKQAEARLLKSERQLRAIFDTEPECVKLLDVKGRLLDMNAAGLRMLDADSVEQLRNRCVFQLIQDEHRSAFRDLTERVFQGESDVLQFGIVGLKGRQLWLETHATPLRDEEGHITALLAVTRDMTERKQMETIVACRTSVLHSIATGASLSTTLHLIVQKVESFAPEMMCLIRLLDAERKHLGHGAAGNLPPDYCQDIDGAAIGPMTGSCGTAAFTGQRVIVEDIAGDPLWEPDRELALRHGLRACWSTPVFDSQKHVLGTFSVYYSQPRQPAGEHLLCVEMIKDVAAIAMIRHMSEKALASSESRYRRLVESDMIGVIVSRSDCRITEANDCFLRMAGYTRDDLDKGRLKWDRMTPPEWDSADTRAVAQIQSNGTCRPFEKEYFRGDGSRVRILVAATLLEDSPGDCICLITDLTDRERVTEALRESEASLAAAQARAHLGSWELDPRTMSGTWSAEMFRLLGRDASLGPPSFDEFLGLVHNEDRAAVSDAQSRISRQMAPVTLEYRTNPLFGPERHLSSTIHIIRNALGKAVRLAGTTLDITARRQAEAAIQRYETIFQQAGWGMAIADPDTHLLTHVNPALATMHGYSVEEMIGMHLSELLAAESMAHLAENARIVHEKGHHTYESQHQRNDGSQFPCLTDVTAFKDATGRVLFRAATFEDITDHKLAEVQLRQSQKMESVGQLAGGIAHDFNNMLTVIDGYAMLLQQEEFCQSETAREYLNEIQTASSRAADFTRRLLAFGRRQFLTSEIINVNEVIDETLRMLERLISRNIIRDVSLDPELKPVRADRGQISQILLNLSLNARDAMPQGGRLTITTQNIEVSENRPSSMPGFPPGEYLLIVVSDTGCGMSPDVQTRVFDPFFTTKPIGKGTGLGLSTVHGIVAQYNGQIEVSSAPGTGSTFRIYLPQASEPEDTLSPTPQPQSIRRGTETILLVEDDEALRRLSRNILTGYGYHVLDAADSESALLICQEHDDSIQLLVTDVVMPGLSGPQLAEEIIKSRPEIRVLFMSGFVADDETRHRLLTEESFFGKPFSPMELASRVRGALDA